MGKGQVPGQLKTKNHLPNLNIALFLQSQNQPLTMSVKVGLVQR